MRSKQQSSAVPCAKVLRHISTELDSQLSRAEYRQIKEHLRRCPNCTIYLDSLKKIIYLYQHIPARYPSGRSRRKLRAVLHLKMKTRTSKKSNTGFGQPVPPFGIRAKRNRQAGVRAH
jgi:predicted anti-sigma-YlaC factor YlaD